MSVAATNILTINGGSSSIKFAIFSSGEKLERIYNGSVEGTSAADLMDQLQQHPAFATVGAVGHRVVHGMAHTEPQPITAELLRELHSISPFVPEHLPHEIELIELFRDRHPALAQIACFDTAFHHGMPRIARLIAIPRRFDAKGVQRYGFHGLSYSCLMEELTRDAGSAAANGRVILAHLGNGASLAAVRGGKSVDTSMGFSPASGLVMGTRVGDVDAGLVSYLSRLEKMSAPEIERMMNRESGMLGISGTSADMRDLLARESTDVRAAEAVALFCYQARKWIGAFTAVLEGLETLVFAGGIGENAAPVRARICDGLRFLGIELDGTANERNAALISTASSRVAVRVMHTDEELMIARSVARVLAGHPDGHAEARVHEAS